MESRPLDAAARVAFEQYPLFREFSGLWGDHDGEVLVDYGCGPGNDLVGFAIHTGARKIIGIDVSPKALGMAAERLALHRVDPTRVELIHKSDASAAIPLADASADYVQSQGVIHHAPTPTASSPSCAGCCAPAAGAA